MSPGVFTFGNFCSFEVFSSHEIKIFEKAQFTNNCVIQLYIAREGSGSGIQILIWRKTSGSRSYQKVRI